MTHSTAEVVLALLTGAGAMFVACYFFWRHQAWFQKGMKVPKR